MTMALKINKGVKLLFAAIPLAIILVPLSWYLSASVRGNLVARWDIAHGHYRLLSYGLPLPWRANYDAKLRARYGVDSRPVAGCIVSSTLRAYVRGYDNLSSDAIRQRFGRDVLQQTWDESAAEWNKNHPESAAR